MTNQQESLMEKKIADNIDSINDILTHHGITPPDIIVYPQFCSMYNIEQLKNIILKLITP